MIQASVSCLYSQSPYFGVASLSFPILGFLRRAGLEVGSLHLLCKGSVSMEDFISKFSGTDGTILMIYLINASDELPQLNVSR